MYAFDYRPQESTSVPQTVFKQRWGTPFFPHIFHIYCTILTVPSSRILRYLCLSEFEELFYFFLIVGSKLLTQSRLCTDDQVISSHKSETLCWSKSTIFIFLVILWAFSRMCTVEPLQPSALCVFIESLRLLSSSGRHPFLSLENFCCLFALGQFFVLPSPASHHGFIDA